MDQPHKDPRVGHGEETTFSMTDYSTDPAKAIAHAAATGRAVVVGRDGQPCVIITIPIVDLPTLDS